MAYIAPFDCYGGYNKGQRFGGVPTDRPEINTNFKFNLHQVLLKAQNIPYLE
jgi:hypothetical protein